MKYLITILGSIIGFVLLSSLFANWHTNEVKPLVTYDGQSYISDPYDPTYQHSSAKYKSEDSFVLNINYIRQPYGCWASYVTYLVGPVAVPLEEQKSMILSDHVVQGTFHLLYKIPSSLMAGTYKIVMIVYPTCENNFDLRPFIPNLGDVSITIK